MTRSFHDSLTVSSTTPYVYWVHHACFSRIFVQSANKDFSPPPASDMFTRKQVHIWGRLGVSQSFHFYDVNKKSPPEPRKKHPPTHHGIKSLTLSRITWLTRLHVGLYIYTQLARRACTIENRTTVFSMLAQSNRKLVLLVTLTVSTP